MLGMNVIGQMFIVKSVGLMNTGVKMHLSIDLLFSTSLDWSLYLSSYSFLPLVLFVPSNIAN